MLRGVYVTLRRKEENSVLNGTLVQTGQRAHETLTTHISIVRMAERSKALRSGRSLLCRRGFESHF